MNLVTKLIIQIASFLFRICCSRIIDGENCHIYLSLQRDIVILDGTFDDTEISMDCNALYQRNIIQVDTIKFCVLWKMKSCERLQDCKYAGNENKISQCYVLEAIRGCIIDRIYSDGGPFYEDVCLVLTDGAEFDYSST